MSDRPAPARAAEGPGASPAPRFYYPELDGLRFVAFLAVFAFHALGGTPALPAGRQDALTPGWWLSSAVAAGTLGVDLFFALSGFLITALLLREADTRGAIDVRAFWMRRILRIWPLYFAFLLVGAAVESLPWPLVAAFGLFVGNWGLLVWSIGDSAITPLWSVSVEEQFYLLWPLALRAAPGSRLPVLALAMVAAGLAMRVAWLGWGWAANQVWVTTFAHLDSIAVGALIAWRWGGRPALRDARARAGLAAAGTLGLVVSIGAVWHQALHWDASGSIPTRVREGAVPLAGVALLHVAVAAGCGAVLIATLGASRSPLAHPAVVWLGRISYGLYVFHMAALHLLHAVWWPARLVLALGLTVAAAAASYRWLEQPFLRLKRRFTVVPSAPG